MRNRLTAADLAAAWDADPSPTVKALLWEILFLRGTIKRAHAVRAMLGDAVPPRVNSTIWGVFIAEIDQEPCITDGPTKRQTERSKLAVEKIKQRENVK